MRYALSAVLAALLLFAISSPAVALGNKCLAVALYDENALEPDDIAVVSVRWSQVQNLRQHSSRPVIGMRIQYQNPLGSTTVSSWVSGWKQYALASVPAIRLGGREGIAVGEYNSQGLGVKEAGEDLQFLESRDTAEGVSLTVFRPSAGFESVPMQSKDATLLGLSFELSDSKYEALQDRAFEATALVGDCNLK